MKKLVLLAALAALLGGYAAAQDGPGALGFGIISDSSEKGLVGGGIRGSLFVDVGQRLLGPLTYGFEFQGDVKKMAQDKSAFQSTDATVFQFDSTNWAIFYQTSSWDLTVTRWDLDVSPRGYISLDLGSTLQLLAFAGLNYNWNSIDYTIKNTSSGPATLPGTSTSYTAGQETTDTKNLDGVWDVIAGARLTFGAFYAEYLRFLKPQQSGDYSWNSSSKNRLGLGINLRF